MSETKTIKGDVWIQGNSLVQEQILVVAGKDSYSNVVTLIEDIWQDLLSDSGTFKSNGKNYFYWEYYMTDTENDDTEVKINYECPRPKEGLFEKPYDPDEYDSEYAKYWVGKLKTAEENYENCAAIQKKEIVFPGTRYIDQNGEFIEVKETKISNTDLGEITNLLNLF